ncbi:hypothetical protein T492DRAFT_1023521 [Pavlovales sp. CCMP2436]|nr:hypothetical protein T492DRAFT_1023521 [Pavlovales sp. CCMP2436]
MAPSMRVPGVPLQPGMTVRDYTMTDFRRKSKLGYAHGVPTLREKPNYELKPVEIDAPSLGMSLSRDGRAFGKSDAYSHMPQTEAYVPEYVLLDRQVLRYDAYFKEAVHESRLESYRVRRVLIYYYLIDGTLQISEPKVENSGMPQGESKGSVFLSRQVVPKPDGSGNYTPADLLVGTNIEIHGRVFRLADADKHTRELLDARGIALASAEPLPIDPYNAKRQSEKETVLRTQRYFRPRAFEDDLTRYAAAKYGAAATALAPDRLREFLRNDRKVLRFFLAWDDRGSPYGELRPFILHYYLQDDTAEVLEVRRANSGRDPFPAFVKKGVPPPLQKKKRDEEDSLGSFVYLIPKPPHKDFRKMMENDRKILRFMARLDSNEPEDAERVFVLKLFLQDDTIAVFEPPQKNSGLVGGKFFERGAVKPYYALKELSLNAHCAMPLRHRQGLQTFPMSNPEYVLSQLRQGVAAQPAQVHELESLWAAADMGGEFAGFVEYVAFEGALSQAWFELHEQPLITLMRHFHIAHPSMQAVDYKAVLRGMAA